MVSIVRKPKKDVAKVLKGFEKSHKDEYLSKKIRKSVFYRCGDVFKNGVIDPKALNNLVRQEIIESLLLDPNSLLYKIFYFLNTHDIDTNKNIKILFDIVQFGEHNVSVDILVFFKFSAVYALYCLVNSVD